MPHPRTDPRTGDRSRLLADVADRVEAAVDPADPAGRDVVLVGVDGVDGAGKTTFADELAAVLRARGRAVLRAGHDDFHHPRARRYARGRDSAEGFWLDSFDDEAFTRLLLAPLGPGGDRRVRTRSHDLATDAVVDEPPVTVAPGTVVVVDGLFLHRDELADHWHLSVLLDVPFEVSVARMAVRDGSHPDPAAASNARYVGGQRLYHAAADPRARADLVVDNSDLDAPRLVTARPPDPRRSARGGSPAPAR
ncbi:nucleoside/nucleotide kinase family protein [Thalassiella azotivora]